MRQGWQQIYQTTGVLDIGEFTTVFKLMYRIREERQQAVAKRREERAKQEAAARKEMELKEKQARTQAARAHEEKVREEKEKQKAR